MIGKRLSVFLFLCFYLNASGQTIPSNRVFTNGWRAAGYPGEIPSPDVIVKVTDFGAFGNGVSNDAPAVSAAIAGLGGAPGVVFFPAGTYLIQSTINLPAGVVLRGRRSESTTLRFDFINDCIRVSQGQSAPFQPVVSGYTVHSKTITVTDGRVFSTNGYAEIREDNDAAWGASAWANKVVGQILQIAAVTNNALTLATPLRITYQAGLNPEIRPIMPIMECGVENLKVERLLVGDEASRNNKITINFNYAARCWVRGVEGFNGFGGHIGTQYSTHMDITGCYIHEAHEYDGGGSGYGVRLEFKSGEILVENNIFRMLRHAMLAQAGVNGNVLGYNYSRENHWVNGPNPADLTSDITCHGNYVYANLIEGNICQHIWLDSSHGENGPLNTFFRNRAETRGINISDGQTEGQNFVGNEAYDNTYPFAFFPWPGDGYSLQAGAHFEYANQTESDGLQPAGTDDLMDYSYYLNDDPTQPPPVPAFWNIPDAIPTVGSTNAFLPSKKNPAYVRYFSGITKTVGPPSIAMQPVGLTVNAGEPAVFFIEAYGTPSNLYVWSKDGMVLAGETNATLSIASAQVGDAGIYRVRVTDDYGSVSSAPAALLVTPEPRSGTMILVK